MATDWKERRVPVTVLVGRSTGAVEETADGGLIEFTNGTRVAAPNGHTGPIRGNGVSTGGGRFAFATTGRAFPRGIQQERRRPGERAMSFDERDGAQADESLTTDTN